MTQMVGGEVLARMLAAEGVEVVFGIVDGTYMGFFGSFEKHGIRMVSPRHETSAAHMAGAYARLTGKLGVCMASNGPGVANILPGVAVENGEGNRVLVVTSSRRTPIAYPDRGGTYQYFNQAGVTRAMSKWSGAVPSFERLPEFFRRALRISWSGRPGVVHLDVPETIMNGVFEAESIDLRPPPQYRRTTPIEPTPSEVKEAAALLRGAERPHIHSGYGVLHAHGSAALQDVVEALGCPATTSWAGRGAMPDNHEQLLPIWAMEPINQSRREADVVLVVGSRLGETDWWGKPPYWGKPGEQKMVQVDIDDEILGLNKATEVAILADANAFLSALAAELRHTPLSADKLQANRARTSSLVEGQGKVRAQLDAALQNTSVPMHSAHVPVACQKVFGDDAVYVFDGGNATVWASFFSDINQPDALLSTFKFGMLGAGVSQALGGQIARPDATVVCIIGDGAMGFHMQELETALRNALPVIYLVLCDKQWGMVKLTQTIGLQMLRPAIGTDQQGTINADFEEIAFDKVAEAMGCHGERVADAAELESALRRCVESGKPSVVHVDVDPNMHLFAPGLQEFKAMHQEPGA
ncbi:MAG: thiamine pyrophosphate-binding protein [Deltaproteobacteria bacterium]|jgi:acetolactate synthase-1/2/3 large subunit|nr:thiamine pyrophosphate-binding protein [Deltaproteobacteria bacterium]